MNTPHFEAQKITRQFGKLLVISCLLEKENADGITITNWIAKKLAPSDKELGTYKLPSSFIYPLLKELTSGHVSFLKEKEGNYFINPEMTTKRDKGPTWLQINFGESTTASIVYLKKLVEILEQTEIKIIKNGSI